MAFSPAAPPKRSGDYTRFVIRRATSVPPSTGDIVAVIFVDEWGPLEEPVELNDFQEYLDVFGQPSDPDAPSEGFIGVYNAFKGESRENPGAGTVVAFRLAGSAAAKASRGLDAGATAPAITLTAKYEGTRGNLIKTEVVANAANPGTQRDVRIYLDDTIVEHYKGYTSAQITTLQDDINKRSEWVVASGAVNGTILDAEASTALTGGNNGATTVAGDWVGTGSATAKLESSRFGYVVAANLTDPAIQTSIATWAANLNGAEKAKRFFYVEGGAAGETYSTASTRAGAANNENVVTFGVGTYRDTALNMELSTAQLAPRLAGVMAARGGRSSLSFAYLEDLEIVVGPEEDEIIDSLEDGIVVVALGGAGVRIERGVTTYTGDTTEKPFETFSRIKYVTTMQSFEREGKEANEDGKTIGLLQVNDDTREEIVSRENQRLQQYVLRGEVKSSVDFPARVYLDPEVPVTDEDEHVAIVWQGLFGRALEQVRRTVVFS